MKESVRIDYKIRIARNLYQLLRRHAFERSVSCSRLICDILQYWCATVTDPNDASFTPSSLGFNLPGMPEERVAGYLASLGCDDDVFVRSVTMPLHKQDHHWSRL